MTNQNKQICELLGIKWHEPKRGSIEDLLNATSVRTDNECICGAAFRLSYDLSDHIFINRPADFTTDPGKLQLLREMRKRDDWPKFIEGELGYYTEGGIAKPNSWIDIDYLLDTTGKLADAALEFLTKEPDR